MNYYQDWEQYIPNGFYYIIQLLFLNNFGKMFFLCINITDKYQWHDNEKQKYEYHENMLWNVYKNMSITLKKYIYKFR